MRQQNALLPGPLVEQRIAEVADLYNTTDIGAAWAFLRRYGVEYIVVGGLERLYYADVGLAKFPGMARYGLLRDVFSAGTGSDQLTIYQVQNVAQ